MEIKQTIEVDEQDWPRCGPCNTVVENFFIEEDYLGNFTMVAKCHGDREEVELSPRLLREMEHAMHVRVGTAFTGEIST